MIKNINIDILSRIEKWTKTDTKYLFRGGFWLSVSSIFASLSAILLAIAYANFIPKEIYGQYKYISSIFAILSIPALNEMNVAITRAIASGREGSLLPAFKARIKWGLLGSLLSIGVSIYYYSQNDITLSISFLLLSIFIPLLSPLNSYSSILNGKKDFKTAAKYFTLTEVLSTAIIIVAIIFTNNLFVLILSYFGSKTILNLLFFKLCLKRYHLNNINDPYTISYGKHLTVMSILSNISQHIDKIIIWHYLGVFELAIYAFALAPADQIKGFLKNIVPLSLPKMSQNTKENLKKTLPLKIYKFTLITLLITIIFILFAPLIYRLLFPEYIESLPYAKLYAATIILYPFSLFSTAMNSQGEKKKLYLHNLLSNPIRIILMAAMIPIWGITGVIIALIVAQLVSISILKILFQKM